VHDPVAVGGGQGVGDLRAQLEHLLARQRALAQAFGEALPVQVLHDQERHRAGRRGPAPRLPATLAG
jgi:hypothetical protein